MSTPQGLGALPSRYGDDAPAFKSNHPEELDDFLLELDALAKTFGVKDNEKVHAAIRYADSSARSLWKEAKGYDDDISKCDWPKFKKELTDGFYPVLRKTKCSLRDLEDIVRRWRRKPLTAERLETYHLEFTPVVRRLEKKGLVTTAEEQRWFWRGIERSARQRIEDRLCQVDTSWDRESPPTIDNVMSTGRWVLKTRTYDDSFTDEEDEPSTRRSKRSKHRQSKRVVESDNSSSDDSEIEAPPKPAKASGAVKTRALTVDDLSAAFDKMAMHTSTAIDKMSTQTTSTLQTMLQPLVSYVCPPAPTAPAYAATTYQFKNPAYQPGNNTGPSFNTNHIDGCFFCGEPGHMMSACRWIAAYIAARRIIQADRLIRFLNGTAVRVGLRGLKSTIDEFFGGSLPDPASPNAPQPASTSNAPAAKSF